MHMIINLMYFMGVALFVMLPWQLIKLLGGLMKNSHEKCLLGLIQLSSAISKCVTYSMICVSFTILCNGFSKLLNLNSTLIFHCRSFPQPASLIPNCMAISTVQ